MMQKDSLRSRYITIVNALSFSAELQKMRRDINARIDAPSTIDPGPYSHPLGVSRSFKRRRISIAEAYLMVIRDLESGQAKRRLRALRMMMDVSLHAKTLDLPLNTARVQIALIKEAIKNRRNRRKQLELLQDFSVSVHGQHQIIRRLLNELNIIELPETGARLKNLDAGWDEHVHDVSTSGRKNPTQLLTDAFIKGISRLTIAYSSPSSLDMMMEAVDAGKIVGIQVSLALEFSVFVHGARFHFMAILPRFKSGKETARWFKEHTESLKSFLDGLEQNQTKRIESVRALLHLYNDTFLPALNEGYPKNSLYLLPKLKLKELKLQIPLASISRSYLGEFMLTSCRPIFFNRVMLHKSLYRNALNELKLKNMSEAEAKRIEQEYQDVRGQYLDLDSERLRKSYFSNPTIGDYHTVFSDLNDLKQTISASGCTIRLLHPLEHGIKKARTLLAENHGIIDQIELYNTQDSAERKPGELIELANLINDINMESEKEGRPPYTPVCGSDSTGRNPRLPGMGFIKADTLSGSLKKEYTKRHKALPQLLSAMLGAQGKPVEAQDLDKAPAILCMGKTSSEYKALVGDEGGVGYASIPLKNAWRYLNPSMVNAFLVVTGFIISFSYIGIPYAILWFMITGFRTSIADLVAGRGTRLREWNLRGINFSNVSRALFWSGLSVPLLGFVKTRFDILWPGQAEGLLFDAVKFFVISFTNGLYLMMHNTLRGFKRNVIRANFFRSVLSWPLATLAAPLGNLLGIPTIVQAKIWSDFVAAFIEGGAKYLSLIKLRRRDLEEIVPLVVSEESDERFSALLDLLYLFRDEPRTASSLVTILAPGYRSLGIFKIESETQACTFDQLYGVINDKHLERHLVDFILTRYKPDMSVELLDLATVTLQSFRTWLSARSRRFSQA
ncbi:MAG: hypothetical protein RBT62_07590 [Spirochaetia bacterium]|jgi:hypothetical protein|nr:hypothetical protein [Spirochaetia bacterium]